MNDLITLEESRSLMLELREKYFFNRGLEHVQVQESFGRELGGDIIATDDSPPFHLASYDGFALASGECSRYPLKISGAVYSGDEKIKKLEPGQAISIATGARLPEGADSVLKLEDSDVQGNLLYGVPIEKWTKVVKQGSNYRTGECVLKKGMKIRPQEIGLISGMGIQEINVFEKPKIAVISTGDEIHTGIRKDTNGPMICALLEKWGCKPIFLGTVPDDLSLIKKKLGESKDFHGLITSGGVSVGNKDFVVRAISEMGEIIFHRVRTRPGKPMVVGIIGGKPVFGLPGKPTGAFMAAELNLRNYFLGEESRGTVTALMAREIKMALRGFTNVVFVNLSGKKAIPVGYGDSPLELMENGDYYNVSTIASSLRAGIADGYVLADTDIQKGGKVEVILF